MVFKRKNTVKMIAKILYNRFQYSIFSVSCHPVFEKEEGAPKLLALGTHQGVRLPMEGSELPGVLLNSDFLRDASMGVETGMGKRVIVLDGGNVAFDCARTARRLGAEEIHLACLEAREKMTADEEEIEQAQEEGIQIHLTHTFEAILGPDRVSGVRFCIVKSFTFDENRRAVIEKEENSEHVIEADTVIFAVAPRFIFCPAWLCGWAIGLTILSPAGFSGMGSLPLQIGAAMLVGVWYVEVFLNLVQKRLVRLFTKHSDSKR